jgi:hypothetical protein
MKSLTARILEIGLPTGRSTPTDRAIACAITNFTDEICREYSSGPWNVSSSTKYQIQVSGIVLTNTVGTVEWTDHAFTFALQTEKVEDSGIKIGAAVTVLEYGAVVLSGWVLLPSRNNRVFCVR